MRTGLHHGPMRSSFSLVGWQKITLMLSLLPVSLVVVGCTTEQGSGSGTKQGSGSGNVTRETRSVSGFSEVALSGTGNLTIRQTGSESLTIEAEDNVIPYIDTTVENNRLSITTRNMIPTPTQPINYELTVKDLSALQLLGAGTIDASGISTDSLNATASGTGDIRVAGKVDSQDVTVLGAGSYKAGDLQSKQAKINISGAGNAIVNVSDELDAAISGAGSVEYIGNPTVNRNITGFGSVSRR